MRLKRKFGVKAGRPAFYVFIYKETSHAITAEEVFDLRAHLKPMKNTKTLSATKVRKFYFMTKFSSKNPDFAKST